MEQNIPLWIVSSIVLLVNLYLAVSARLQTKGKESGSVETDLRYIKEMLTRIENRFAGELARQEDRWTQLSRQTGDLISKAAKHEESLHAAHKQIQALEQKFAISQ